MQGRFVLGLVMFAALSTPACGGSDGGGGGTSPNATSPNATGTDDTSGIGVTMGGTATLSGVASGTIPGCSAYVGAYSGNQSGLTIVCSGDSQPPGLILDVLIGFEGTPTPRTWTSADGNTADFDIEAASSLQFWHATKSPATGSYSATITSVGSEHVGPTYSTFAVHGSVHATLTPSSSGATGELVADVTF